MKLKELREKHKLTQKKLAEILDIPYTTLNGYERNAYQPNIETLIRMANYFCISLDELVGRDYQNTIDKSKLSELENELIQLLLELDENNQQRLEGYAMALWKNQQDEKITIQNLKTQHPDAYFEIIKKENK